MIEYVRPGASAAHARVGFFDFDGTISLVRTGWMDTMVPLMVEVLAKLRTGETEEELAAIVREFVWRLTGKETIYQMMELADQVRARGGSPKEPLEYKKIYLDRLWERIRGRVEDLEAGRVAPDTYLVPGARALLEELKDRGLQLYLASGTDHEAMSSEARLLDVTKYFDGGVYGAQDDLKSFSKRILVERILRQAEFTGDAILGFGDGFVEIQEVKRAGGVAVGVATSEPECKEIDDWKRQRLIGVGADYIVANYLCHKELVEVLFDGRPVEV